MVVKSGYIRVVECFEFTKIQKITTFIRARRMISSGLPRKGGKKRVFTGTAGPSSERGISRNFT